MLTSVNDRPSAAMQVIHVYVRTQNMHTCLLRIIEGFRSLWWWQWRRICSRNWCSAPSIYDLTSSRQWNTPTIDYWLHISKCIKMIYSRSTTHTCDYTSSPLRCVHRSIDARPYKRGLTPILQGLYIRLKAGTKSRQNIITWRDHRRYKLDRGH